MGSVMGIELEVYGNFQQNKTLFPGFCLNRRPIEIGVIQKLLFELVV